MSLTKIIKQQLLRHTYKSKYNIKREIQVIILMTTESKRWYYAGAKNCRHYSVKQHQSMMETVIA